ncbi:MAG: hypothetical protein MUD12_00745 [Spirochaetes bacterium]|nr:hypothetical protein [Spirochaetota bacterium]
MIIEIILVFIFYLLLVIAGSYYVDLFLTKDEFTKEELKSILPYLLNYWNSIIKKYTMTTFFTILGVSSIIGILIPMIIYNWLGNSSMFFALVFFMLPMAKRHFEQSQVNTSESLADSAINIFVRYSEIIVIGFGAGNGSALIYNFRPMEDIHFLWFFVNIVLVTIMLGMAVRKAME